MATLIRSGDSKWSVDTSQWQDPTYPDFLSGWCYLASPDAVRMMVDHLDNLENVFWIDDVMVTGVVADMSKIKRISLNSYFTLFPEEMSCCSNVGKTEKCPYLIGPTDHNPQLLNKLLKKQDDCNNASSNCSLPENKCKIVSPISMSQFVKAEVISV